MNINKRSFSSDGKQFYIKTITIQKTPLPEKWDQQKDEEKRNAIVMETPELINLP